MEKTTNQPTTTNRTNHQPLLDIIFFSQLCMFGFYSDFHYKKIALDYHSLKGHQKLIK